MKRLLYWGLLVGFAWSFAVAANVPPDRLIKETTDKVLAELTTNRETFLQDHEKLFKMVDEIVLPHFDFMRMSKLVLGRHWRDANEEQRSQFVGEFKTLLVRTYATALFEYNGQKIAYKPARFKEGDTVVVIKTEIVPADGPPIPLNYSLSKRSETWKVIDIRIDGISLVTNYRIAYGRKIQEKGIDALISSLAARNKVAPK